VVDPLDTLSTPIEPVFPEPAFTAALRARLLRALQLPQGVVMTDLAGPEREPEAATTSPFPRPGALPYFSVRGARAAIDFYAAVFGARLLGEPIVMPDGRIGHCELSMGGGVVYLAEEFPEMGLTGPATGRVSVSLMLPVDDTEAVLERAREAGATVEREAADNHGRRGATLVDPFGHRWMLSSPLPAGPVEPIRHGDIGYVSWWTPDAERAERFYHTVLGWAFSAQGHQVANVTGHQGLEGGHERSTLFCCYAVDDIDAVVQVIRAGGGSAEEPTDNPHGHTSMCVDPTGTPFAVYQPQPGDHRPSLHGLQTGDLTYVTFRPQGPSAAARKFYGSLLGWEFTPGHVEDGWEPAGVHPMAGMAGDGDGATVPMWKVPDVAAAVDRVREAGGTVVSEPAQQPYGTRAECLDDQGGRFYLGDA